MPVPTRESKPALRAWAREARALLDLPLLSREICVHLEALPAFQKARHVLLYAAMPDEIDVLSLAWTPEKRFYLPRCGKNRRLTIHEYPCPLVVSAFGIREPASELPEIDPGALDLALVPGLAFTVQGGRLGQGGGYYDRFLPRLSESCITVGVSPEALVTPSLPTDSWDQKLSLVVTEQGVAGSATSW
jgi:5-formyltetrahydrofolate cyclo-ligase